MRLSLKTKVILSHILPIALLVPLFSLFLLSNLRGFYIERLRDQLTFDGVILAKALEATPSLASDPGELQAMLRGLDASSSTRIQIISAKGVILASTEAEVASRVGTLSQEPGVQTALQGKPSLESSQKDIATVLVPVASQQVGAIRLSLQTTDVDVAFNLLNELVISAILGFTLLNLLLTYVLGPFFSKPLQQLAAEAKAMAAGDLSRRVEVRGKDELGDLAASLNYLASELEKQRAEREKTLDDLAHEFRRPICALRTAAEVIAGAKPQDKQSIQPLLDGLVSEMNRLGRLTKRLAFAAQDGHGKNTFTWRPIDMGSIAGRVVTLFEPEAHRQGIALNCQVFRTLPPLQADEDAIDEILTNLIDNALKFTPAGGKVCVSAGTDEEGIWVEVSDTGIGLTEAEQACLFSRFYRGDPARSRPPGIGLGLSIVRDLVQAHEGTIKVQSQPNQGTTFRVVLPHSRVDSESKCVM